MLFVSSRAFSLSIPTFLLSIPVENSEATWKKATKCNKCIYAINKCESELYFYANHSAMRVHFFLPDGNRTCNICQPLLKTELGFSESWLNFRRYFHPSTYSILVDFLHYFEYWMNLKIRSEI